MARHAGHRAPRPVRHRAGHALGLRVRQSLWRQKESRILLGGLATALALMLLGGLFPLGGGAAASSPPSPAIDVTALVRAVAAQGGSGPTAAQRDRAAAAAWLAAVQQLAVLTAADAIRPEPGGPSGSAASPAPQDGRPAPTGPAGVALPQQASLDESAARRLLAALPATWTPLQRASLVKNNDRIGNRDDEWSRADRTVEPNTPRATAVGLLATFGFGLEQWGCLDRMWWQESNWRPAATTGAAYGIPQALPGEKMAAAGADWRTNPTTQVLWGLAYIASTYGTPCDAWTFWSQHYWY